MSYVEKTLSQDEVIKETIKLHWTNYFWPVFFVIILVPITIEMLSENTQDSSDATLIILLAWIVILYYFLRLWSIEMVVTNKRVVCKKGIIATHTEELKNAKIESVEVKQGVVDRLLGTGCIYFSGTGTSKLKFENVDKPWKIKSNIEEYIGD